MTVEDLAKTIEKNGVETSFGENLKVKITDDISQEDLLEVLGKIYDFEIENDTYVILDLKGLKTELLANAVKYSLTREDLKNPVMILNILNLVKIYNTLDDAFFADESIYVNSIENLLDLKLAIRSELKAFSKQLSIYFISLFKSYNKTMYTPLDNHIALPNIYKTIILSTDLMTLSGIFAVSESFSTEDCVYIEEAFSFLTELLTKNMVTINMMEGFFKGLDDGISK